MECDRILGLPSGLDVAQTQKVMRGMAERNPRQERNNPFLGGAPQEDGASKPYRIFPGWQRDESLKAVLLLANRVID